MYYGSTLDGEVDEDFHEYTPVKVDNHPRVHQIMRIAGYATLGLLLIGGAYIGGTWATTRFGSNDLTKEDLQQKISRYENSDEISDRILEAGTCSAWKTRLQELIDNEKQGARKDQPGPSRRMVRRQSMN
jgi:hypothetical protein